MSEYTFMGLVQLFRDGKCSHSLCCCLRWLFLTFQLGPQSAPRSGEPRSLLGGLLMPPGEMGEQQPPPHLRSTSSHTLSVPSWRFLRSLWQRRGQSPAQESHSNFEQRFWLKPCFQTGKPTVLQVILQTILEEVFVLSHMGDSRKGRDLGSRPTWQHTAHLDFR